MCKNMVKLKCVYNMVFGILKLKGEKNGKNNYYKFRKSKYNW